MRIAKRGTLLAYIIGAGLLTGCGNEEKPDPPQAFLRGTMAHHRSAVDMAEVAQTEARSGFTYEGRASSSVGLGPRERPARRRVVYYAT